MIYRIRVLFGEFNEDGIWRPNSWLNLSPREQFDWNVIADPVTMRRYKPIFN